MWQSVVPVAFKIALQRTWARFCGQKHRQMQCRNRLCSLNMFTSDLRLYVLSENAQQSDNGLYKPVLSHQLSFSLMIYLSFIISLKLSIWSSFSIANIDSVLCLLSFHAVLFSVTISSQSFPRISLKSVTFFGLEQTVSKDLLFISVSPSFLRAPISSHGRSCSVPVCLWDEARAFVQDAMWFCWWLTPGLPHSRVSFVLAHWLAGFTLRRVAQPALVLQSCRLCVTP